MMLNETDVKDKHGNIVIEPELKVRHKESQYEYTIEDVVEEDDGEVTVILRMPEEPRFTPPPDEPETMITDTRDRNDVLYEVDPDGLYFEPEPGSVLDIDDDTALMAVPQKEFEKEYEVK